MGGAPEDDEAAEQAERLDESPDGGEPRAAGSLLRLLTFGRQRAGLMLLGFVLTVGVTVAGLIPPYLTEPLTDALFTIHDTGDEGLRIVIWCLVGIGVAAVVAWLLAAPVITAAIYFGTLPFFRVLARRVAATRMSGSEERRPEAPTLL